MATTAEYVRAFRKANIKPQHAAMLRAHANAHRGYLSAAELARAAGDHKYGFANLEYGKLAHEVFDALETRVPINSFGGRSWTWVLATYETKQRDDKGHPQWRMRDEVIAALRELNMA